MFLGLLFHLGLKDPLTAIPHFLCPFRFSCIASFRLSWAGHRTALSAHPTAVSHPGVFLLLRAKRFAIPNAFFSYKNLFAQLLLNAHQAMHFPLSSALKSERYCLRMAPSDFTANAGVGIFSSTCFFFFSLRNYENRYQL